jgi:hypothetical protein
LRQIIQQRQETRTTEEINEWNNQHQIGWEEIWQGKIAKNTSDVIKPSLCKPNTERQLLTKLLKLMIQQ